VYHVAYSSVVAPLAGARFADVKKRIIPKEQKKEVENEYNYAGLVWPGA
jgi:hypothetical protein